MITVSLMLSIKTYIRHYLWSDYCWYNCPHLVPSIEPFFFFFTSGLVPLYLIANLMHFVDLTRNASALGIREYDSISNLISHQENGNVHH